MTSLQIKHFLIYKTTNLVNGKVYIGKHVTSSINDGYLGSGKLLKRAIKKYGVDNFKREILWFCSSEDELNQRERELVTEEFCKLPNTYNICVGGKGGFSYINENKLNGFSLSADTARKGRQTANMNGALDKARARREELKQDPVYAAELSAKLKRRRINRNRTHSESSKRKMMMSNPKTTRIVIDGVVYDSITQAAKLLGTYTSLIVARLKNPAYDNYKYVDV